MRWYLVYCILPAGVLYAATRAGDAARWARQGYRRLRPSDPSVAPVDIERISADLRRLARLLEAYVASAPDIPMARRRGAELAYEDRLVDACRALGIPQRLREPWEVHHDFERIRVERALERAGLAFTPPRSADPHYRP
jgi:hypothetical protein